VAGASGLNGGGQVGGVDERRQAHGAVPLSRRWPEQLDDRKDGTHAEQPHRVHGAGLHVRVRAEAADHEPGGEEATRTHREADEAQGAARDVAGSRGGSAAHGAHRPPTLSGT
jgi:hypothetical protein